MNFSDWQDQVPPSIREDTLWDVEAYRLGLFASDVCWQDTRTLHEESQMYSLADQLYRAVGSISSNIAEGYSRGTGKDRARFYEYALGSARESRDWYYKSRFVIGEDVVAHRLDFMTQIIRLLLVMVPDQRGGEIREPDPQYRASGYSEKELPEEIPLAS
ncbi:MAG: four helix bundle protein [Salinibacter sp.]|uniref:four helix bundle protein n=1 Tax=Salinibacter sp. TaxID=2065818 RepID=UPI002FC2F05A